MRRAPTDSWTFSGEPWGSRAGGLVLAGLRPMSHRAPGLSFPVLAARAGTLVLTVRDVWEGHVPYPRRRPRELAQQPRRALIRPFPHTGARCTCKATFAGVPPPRPPRCKWEQPEFGNILTLRKGPRFVDQGHDLVALVGVPWHRTSAAMFRATNIRGYITRDPQEPGAPTRPRAAADDVSPLAAHGEYVPPERSSPQSRAEPAPRFRAWIAGEDAPPRAPPPRAPQRPLPPPSDFVTASHRPVRRGAPSRRAWTPLYCDAALGPAAVLAGPPLCVATGGACQRRRGIIEDAGRGRGRTTTDAVNAQIRRSALRTRHGREALSR